MARWRPDARGRLETAAFELFTEQGFAATTVPQIAARAGLTTRTFFRHFADKREVIFDGDAIPSLARGLIADAPAEQQPLELVVAALPAVGAARFDGRRERVRALRDLVRGDPGLVERDLRKRADLAAAIRDGFLARGRPPLEATLLGDVCVAVVQVALDDWLDRDDDVAWAAVAADALESVRALFTRSN